MSNATEENKQNITTKRIVREFNLYWKFMCTDKNNDNNKTNLPPATFHSFLNCRKTTKFMTLKF